MKQTKPIRVVPLRQLQRYTRSVVDLLREEKQSLLLTDHGEPFALVVPVSRDAEPLQPGSGEAPLETTLEHLPSDKAAVARAVAEGIMAVDHLLRDTGLTVAQLTLALARLEIKGVIRKRGGGYELK